MLAYIAKLSLIQEKISPVQKPPYPQAIYLLPLALIRWLKNLQQHEQDAHLQHTRKQGNSGHAGRPGMALLNCTKTNKLFCLAEQTKKYLKNYLPFLEHEW